MQREKCSWKLTLHLEQHCASGSGRKQAGLLEFILREKIRREMLLNGELQLPPFHMQAQQPCWQAAQWTQLSKSCGAGGEQQESQEHQPWGSWSGS